MFELDHSNPAQVQEAIDKTTKALFDEPPAGDRIGGLVNVGLVALETMQTSVSGQMGPEALKFTPNNLRTVLLALMVEMGEVANSSRFKPWKRGEVDVDDLAEEIADCLAFLGLFLIYLRQMGVTTKMISDAYVKKSEKNIRRLRGLEPGYEANATSAKSWTD